MKPPHQRMRSWKGAEETLADDRVFMGGGAASGMRSTVHKTLDLFLTSPEWKGSTVTFTGTDYVTHEVKHPSGAVARFELDAFSTYAAKVAADKKKARR